MKTVPKIDMHVHTTPEPLLFRLDGSALATPRELRTIYDAIGVERALLLPTPEEISMREARDLVRGNPDVFGWWFLNFSLHGPDCSPDADLSRIMNAYKAHGARGVGEVTENLYFDDPLMLNLFHHAQACGLPVTFHIGSPGKGYGIVDDLGLPRLEKVLGMFPRLRFLGHSKKFWAEIGQCDARTRKLCPTGKVVPGRVVELMRRYPNLCGDLSAGSGANAIMRDPAFGYAFLEEFQDRLYYGTDICDRRNLTSPMLRLSGFLDDAMRAGKISYAAYEKISRANALALLEK